VFFEKLNPDAFSGECLHNPAQVIQVSAKPVHAMVKIKQIGKKFHDLAALLSYP